MKIGILSMQRVYNYGSFLQAFGLKTLMEQRGHEVTYVDIEKKKDYVPKKKSKFLIKLKKIKYFDRYFFKRMDYSKKNKELNRLFYEADKEYLGLTDDNMTAEGLDAVIIGSDEIFNCSPESVWGVTGQRFGDIPEAGKTLSYAASCGYTALEDMDKDDRKIITAALGKLECVSVRDENTRKFVNELTGKEPQLNLDPVLMYDFKNEIEKGEKEGIPDYPYMIVYAYHNRIKTRKEIKAIKGYAAKKGLKTISIGGSLPWCDEFAVISPFQVLAYFKHADCIVTDTFHGTVMAAKLNKPLAVLVRDSNSNKLEDLLTRLNIENHKVTDIERLKEALDINNDYERCNDIVDKECQHTERYFDNAGL